MNYLQALAMMFMRGKQAPQMGIAQQTPDYGRMAQGLLGQGLRIFPLASKMAVQNSIQSGIAAGADVGMGAGATGMGALGQFGSALPGIGTAMAGTYLAGNLLNTGIGMADKAIFGEGTHIWEEPTSKLINQYKQGQAYTTPVIAAEMRRRGASIPAPTSADWKADAYHTSGHSGNSVPANFNWNTTNYNDWANLYAGGANA